MRSSASASSVRVTVTAVLDFSNLFIIQRLLIYDSTRRSPPTASGSQLRLLQSLDRGGTAHTRTVHISHTLGHIRAMPMWDGILALMLAVSNMSHTKMVRRLIFPLLLGLLPSLNTGLPFFGSSGGKPRPAPKCAETQACLLYTSPSPRDRG